MRKANLVKTIIISLLLIAGPINANSTSENQCSDKNESQCLSKEKNKERKAQNKKIKGKNDIVKYMTATLASLFAFKNIESLTSENSTKPNVSITIEGNNNNNNDISITSNAD